jgi:hypothetical protein
MNHHAPIELTREQAYTLVVAAGVFLNDGKHMINAAISGEIPHRMIEEVSDGVDRLAAPVMAQYRIDELASTRLAMEAILKIIKAFDGAQPEATIQVQAAHPRAAA